MSRPSGNLVIATEVLIASFNVGPGPFGLAFYCTLPTESSRRSRSSTSPTPYLCCSHKQITRSLPVPSVQITIFTKSTALLDDESL